MASVALQSFNAFLTDRLTAAAVEIFGYVEKTIVDYNEEVYRTKQENQRLQRLLDLVYKPEIKLHRADTNQPKQPSPAQEVPLREKPNKPEWTPGVRLEQPVFLEIKQEQDEPICSEEQPSTTAGYSDDHLNRYAPAVHRDQTLKSDRLGKGGPLVENDPLHQHVDHGPPSAPEPNCSMKSDWVYQCHMCYDRFSDQAQLSSHLRAHTKYKGMYCYVCGITATTRSELERHLRVHTGERPYACVVCGNRYKWKSHIKEHMKTHTGERPYTCYICGKSFIRGTTMSKHVRITHKESKPFKCMHCGLCFSMQVLMKQHIREVHVTPHEILPL